MINKFKFREIKNPPRPLSQGGIDCRTSKATFLKTKNAGFALIEVIISMVILSVVMGSAVGLLFSVSTAVEVNRDRLAATYLAQECLELVRNARDTSWLNYNQWNCAWESESNCAEKSIIEHITKNEIVVYTDDQGDDHQTKFSREFTTKDIKNSNPISAENQAAVFVQTINAVPEAVEITCKVSWDEHELSIAEILTNWRKI